MARIPETEIERLKKEVAIERLAEARGIELKKHGADLMGLCPFHADKSPSLVISPKKNLWHCLGACQAGGSVVDWVMKSEGVSFRHAVELLRADLPLAGATHNGEAVKVSSVRKLPPLLDSAANDHAALAQVADYYHQTLKQSPEALAYLEKRGLGSAEMIERFKLGFANRTLGLRLPEKNRRLGDELRTRLQRLGIIRESGHEHFNGRIVVPIFDEEGHVVGMYGRTITPNLRPGTPDHIYMPGPHRGVWNWQGLVGAKSIILCEALIDALTFWCAGHRNVTSAYGIEGFTDEVFEAIKRHGVETVLIAYDRDDAGERGAAKAAKRLIDAGIECYRVQFPKGMDANEYARKVTPAGKSLDLVIKQAVFLGGTKVEKAAAPRSPPAPAARPAPAPPEPEPAPEIPSLAAPTAPPASPPAPAAAAVDAEADEVRFVYGDRRWRVRGLSKNTSFDALRVNIHVARGEAFHVDTLDVYAARTRVMYVKQAAGELGVSEDVLKADIGRLLLALEEMQDKRIREAMTPVDPRPVLSEQERDAALALLRDPQLLDRILVDFGRCGVVGEEVNKLVGYLGAVSRKLEAPLAVIIQSSTAAGKSSLMEAILALVPEEDRVKYAAMTGQSLFYMGETDLRHKVLAIVEEAGAARASYALKILQSEGELTIASTGKDPETGRLVTHEYRVEGPVMIFLTTTAVDIDEELLNRCIVLTVDEERAQTQAIHRIQREAQTLEGLLARQSRADILKLHRNAQRLLRPLLVANPYARELTFLDDRTRTRRDHIKYLTLIRTIALLHQHQREVKAVEHEGKRVEYIEVALEDIAVANRLAHQVLGRSLDELPPQTRRLLMALDELVGRECGTLQMRRGDFRFTRRQVREATGWGDTQLKVHVGRLVELEYVVAHRTDHGQGLVYELAYDGGGKDGTPYLAGLLDVGTRREYDGQRSGVEAPRSGSGRPLVGPWSAGGRGEGTALLSNENLDPDGFESNGARNSHLDGASENLVVVAGA